MTNRNTTEARNEPLEIDDFQSSGVIDAQISPRGTLEMLSQWEVDRLRDMEDSKVYELFRRCALAVLNCDDSTDNASEVYSRYADFSIEISQRARGIKLILKNAPACAFVDGVIMHGVRDHLFAVLRDIVFMSGDPYALSDRSLTPNTDAQGHPSTDTEDTRPAANLVFNMMRNARLLRPRAMPKLIVCWGGH